MRKFIYICVITLLLLSCSSQQKIVEVPVETVRTEYITDHRKDSIYVHDSIDRYIKGDTVYQDRYRYKYKYVNRTDTVLKTDTIPQIITQTKTQIKEVNKIRWWQSLLMYIGVGALAISVVWLYNKVSPLVGKLRNRNN